VKGFQGERMATSGEEKRPDPHLGETGGRLERALRDAKEIVLATRRRDGSTSRGAPVWFWYDGERVYFTVAPDSHKARRIARGSPVFGRAGGAGGVTFSGDCSPVSDLRTVEEIGRMYGQKYWIAWLGFFRPRPSRIAAGKTLMFCFTPRATAPDQGSGTRD